MRQPVVFMFSGQGSQYYHMGKDLYIQNAGFRRWMCILDNMVYQNVGISVVNEIYNEKKTSADQFNDTFYTHLAIFMVEYALARVLIENGLEPDCLLGASLGEFTSAAVSGVLTVEETLECLLKQAELLKCYCKPGGMIAVIDNVELYKQISIISQQIELAAINYSSHFVISGDSEQLSKVINFLKTKNTFFQILPVMYGFHSSNIDSIQNKYTEFLNKISFKKSSIPVLSCFLGGRVTEFSSNHFWNVIRQPIHFEKTILTMEAYYQFNYIDVGPAGTLLNFVKKNLKTESLSKFYDILTPYQKDSLKLKKLRDSLY